MATRMERSMLPKSDKIAFTVIGIIAVLAFATLPFKDEIRSMVGGKASSDETQDKMINTTASPDPTQTASNAVGVTQNWQMPEVLREVSGIAYIDNERIACVQDEQGTIYIYNTQSKSIEKEIPFAAAGDYEGIAIVGSAAYVLRADGHIYEVANYNSKPVVSEYQTHLTAEHDVEGLCYDGKNNRLLLAIKAKEPTTADYKGIYAFDLKTKQSNEAPVFKIDMNHAIWKDVKGKDKMEPSDLDIHPLTGDIYITDGAKPKLLVMDAAGEIKRLFPLDEAQFPQPEGVSFTPEGQLILSSEGKKGAGIIAKVAVAGL